MENGLVFWLKRQFEFKGEDITHIFTQSHANLEYL